MSDQLVAPTDAPGIGELHLEELRRARADAHDDAHDDAQLREGPWLQTVFWMPRPRFAALLREIEDLLYTPRDHAAAPDRLSALPDGELKRFLQHDYPRAASLGAYEREILCLTPLAPAGPAVDR
jgi:hypothetical protein